MANRPPIHAKPVKAKPPVPKFKVGQTVALGVGENKKIVTTVEYLTVEPGEPVVYKLVGWIGSYPEER